MLVLASGCGHHLTQDSIKDMVQRHIEHKEFVQQNFNKVSVLRCMRILRRPSLLLLRLLGAVDLHLPVVWCSSNRYVGTACGPQVQL